MKIGRQARDYEEKVEREKRRNEGVGVDDRLTGKKREVPINERKMEREKGDIK